MNSLSSLLDLELVGAELERQIERLKGEKMSLQEDLRSLTLSRQRR